MRGWLLTNFWNNMFYGKGVTIFGTYKSIWVDCLLKLDQIRVFYDLMGAAREIIRGDEPRGWFKSWSFFVYVYVWNK